MTDVLALNGVTAGYDGSVVIEGVDLRVQAGESLAVLGRNGVGKSTMIATALGLTNLLHGFVHVCGEDVTNAAPYARVRKGIGWVPQERLTFRSLTVDEHLSAVARPGYWDKQRVYEALPLLVPKKRNMGDQLSGGEQQMLAIARALMVNPVILLLDEPLEGLAPIVAQEIAQVVRRLVKQSDLAVVLVEQHARQALEMTDGAIILDRGKIVHHGLSLDLLDNEELLNRWLSVTTGANEGAMPV